MLDGARGGCSELREAGGKLGMLEGGQGGQIELGEAEEKGLGFRAFEKESCAGFFLLNVWANGSSCWVRSF